MRRNAFFKVAASIAVLLFFITGCRKITVTTQVFPDGTCKRTVTVRGDSSAVDRGAYPIPGDSSWTITREKDSTEAGKWIYTAVKDFDGVDGLDSELKLPEYSDKIGIDVSLKKKFRWFISYFEYVETYRAFNRFDGVPIEDYMNREEWELFVQDEDTLDLEDRYEEWSNRAMFQEIYRDLKAAVERLNPPGITVQALEDKKETLFEKCVAMEEPEEGLAYGITGVVEDVMGVSLPSSVREEVVRSFARLEEKIDFMEEVMGDSYENRVSMPGLVMDTDADELEGNVAVWEVNSKQFMFYDYSMTVTSRKVNLWAQIVTAAVLVVVVGWIVFVLIRRRGGRK
jgi:hypothetical protein